MARTDTESQIFYADQTRLALENFPHGGRRLSDVPEFVRAYGLVKLACARANIELGVIDATRGEAIVAAARSVAALEHLPQFRTALVQGGGGTSSNMNVNEVIATLANRMLDASGLLDGDGTRVHPNDHVNASQSTNDTYPTAMSLTLTERAQPALAALAGLREALLRQAEKGGTTRRLGRTCLRDATSLSVEQTHHAQANIVGHGLTALRESIDALRTVPLGGTVLGTGAGAPGGFARVAVAGLSAETGLDLASPADVFAAMAHPDSLATVAAACRQAAIAMARIAADLRFLSAGPVGGPAEVVLPALQNGSSIMPGKVNPVIPELVIQLSYRVRGNAHTAELAVAAGELELNVMGPVALDALLTCLTDIRDAATYFAEKCIDGLQWDRRATEHALSGSLDGLVDLASANGYTAASRQAEPKQAPVVPGDIRLGTTPSNSE
nr:lyase family protein [Phytoactinopolyspora alkaliphila]